MCVGVRRGRENLHCDLSLCNLVSWADSLSVPYDQNNSPETPEISGKKKKTTKCCSTRLCVSVIATMSHLLHFDTKRRYNPTPPPLRVFVRKCLWSFFFFFCTTGEGSVGEGAAGGTRGWVADWRQAVISLPAWHLPTAANPLLISSRPCAWQRRGFQISFSPRVKNPKPYHFVNGYL